MEAISTDLTEEIKSLNSKFIHLYSQGNTAAVADLYTITALLMPAGQDVLKGREAISQYWQHAMETGVKDISLETVEVEQLDFTAIELGTFALKGEGGQPIDQGKYMAVWKRENGHWKMQKDIWNSNQQS
jgi:ketosteroid isomerase-like protein